MVALDSLHRDVKRHHDEIAKLQKGKADEARKAADAARRAGDAAQAARRTTSVSSVQSKIRDVERYEKDQQRATDKVADYEKRIAAEHGRLATAQERLTKAEADAAKKHQKSMDDAFKLQERRHTVISGGLAKATSRHTALDQRLNRLEALPDRLVVLFLAANPLDVSQLRLDEEVRGIVEAIRKSKHRDAVKLESCWAIRPQDVLQAINEHRPRIVHFSGHGTTTDEIVFQDDAGQSKLVTKESMVQLMAACSGDISLVFFNTCFSQGQAEAVVTAVDAAIGMTASISDDVARIFAAQFYSAIGFGLTVSQAFEQAKALVMMEGLGEEKVPKLFMRTGLDVRDLVLVAPPSSDGMTDAVNVPDPVS